MFVSYYTERIFCRLPRFRERFSVCFRRHIFVRFLNGIFSGFDKLLNKTAQNYAEFRQNFDEIRSEFDKKRLKNDFFRQNRIFEAFLWKNLWKVKFSMCKTCGNDVNTE